MVRPSLKWTVSGLDGHMVEVEAVNPTEFSQENPVRLRGTVLPFIGAETARTSCCAVAMTWRALLTDTVRSPDLHLRSGAYVVQHQLSLTIYTV